MTTPTTASKGFAHLHVHSEHSSLDGLGRLADIANKMADDGQKAGAITDHGNLAASWTFAKLARDRGLKPITGIEAYLAIGDRMEKNTIQVASDGNVSDPDADGKDGGTTKTKAYEHLTIIARNATGWKNLIAMSDASHESFVGKAARIDYDLLKKHGDGLFVLTGCLGGPVLGPVSRGDLDEARRNIERLIDCVGQDNVWVEVMEHGIDVETNALPTMVELADEYELPLVATNDAHYVHAEDFDAHDAWLALQTGKTLADKNRFQFHGAGYHLRNEREMRALRDEDWWQDACDNTVLLADLCQDVIPKPKMRLPVFPLPAGFTDAEQYLRHLVTDGAKKRWGDPIPPHVVERLEYELSVIISMGFANYFLIVWDVINWTRAQGHLVGPGRGSAAGAAVSYSIGIVDVDPIDNQLLFERFLEPDRVGMPDIDVDFEQGFRQQVLEYLANRYGRDRVAKIGTFQVAKTKEAIKSAARVLGFTPIGNKLTAEVPSAGGKPFAFSKLLDDLEPQSAGFRRVLDKEGDDATKVIDLAQRLVDTAKGESIHACGTLIADVPMNGLIPLRRDHSKGVGTNLATVTEWDGPSIDEFGLLKLDVLGIRNLDIMAAAARNIQMTTGELIDIRSIPHADTKGDPRVDTAWELLRAARTAGCFQLESSGMKQLLQDVAPDTLNDLSAVIALFRPGPLGAGMHTMYANRKNGLDQVSYRQWTESPGETAAIDSVLGETFGTFVYQEQVMRLSGVVSGFDTAHRSKLRKAIGKKKKDVMDALQADFLSGAAQEFRDDKGNVTSPVVDVRTAAALWESIKGSAEYLFNKSHSIAYAVLAFQTAYLKANWPAQYGAAILEVTAKDAEKRGQALRSLAEEGITILAPDVNRSLAETTALDSKTVILGLAEVKDVGTAGTSVYQERIANGPFSSMKDLLDRLNQGDGKGTFNIGALEGLIQSGALDQFGPRRGMMLVARAAKASRITPPNTEWGILEKAIRQRARLGVALGEHPMVVLADQVRTYVAPAIRDRRDNLYGGPTTRISQLPSRHGAPLTTVGILSQWAPRTYSKGTMVNFTVEDEDSSISGVMWDDAYATLIEEGVTPVLGSVVSVSGRVAVKERDIEDEDGNIVETVITREATALRLWVVDVLDPILVEPDRQVHPDVPGTLRAVFEEAAITAPPMPARPSRTKAATADPEVVPPVVDTQPEPFSAEPFPEEPTDFIPAEYITDVPYHEATVSLDEADSVQSAPVGHVPVLLYTLTRARRPVGWSPSGDDGMVAMAFGNAKPTLDPPGSWTQKTTRVLLGPKRIPVAVVVYVPSDSWTEYPIRPFADPTAAADLTWENLLETRADSAA